MCKTKFSQMCSFSISFTAIPKFPPWFCTSSPWFSAFFRIYTQIPDQDFKKIVTWVQKETLRFATTA